MFLSEEKIRDLPKYWKLDCRDNETLREVIRQFNRPYNFAIDEKDRYLLSQSNGNLVSYRTQESFESIEGVEINLGDILTDSPTPEAVLAMTGIKRGINPEEYKEFCSADLIEKRGLLDRLPRYWKTDCYSASEALRTAQIIQPSVKLNNGRYLYKDSEGLYSHNNKSVFESPGVCTKIAMSDLYSKLQQDPSKVPLVEKEIPLSPKERAVFKQWFNDPIEDRGNLLDSLPRYWKMNCVSSSLLYLVSKKIYPGAIAQLTDARFLVRDGCGVASHNSLSRYMECTYPKLTMKDFGITDEEMGTLNSVETFIEGKPTTTPDSAYYHEPQEDYIFI